MDALSETAETVNHKPCWDCGTVIDKRDNYCRNCGKGQGHNVPWRYTHQGIIIITLLGLGPFTLFYLWRSPVITRNAKLAYTAAISLLTFYVLYLLHSVWVSFQAAMGNMQIY